MKTALSTFLALALASVAGPIAAQTGSTDSDLAKGVRLVDEGDFDAAINALNRVVDKLQAQKGSPRELSRAYLYLAIAHLGLSQEQAAKAKLTEALKTDQSLKLSPYEFPPRVIQALEQVRQELAPAKTADPAKTALVVDAIRQGDFATVRRMLSEDPSLANGKDPSFGATPLHWAALKGNEALVGLLIAEGADLGATNRNGETPLVVAQRAKQERVIPLLRAPDAGAGIFDAAKRGDSARVEQLLRDNPGLANQRDLAFGATPLHWAALRGQVEVARILMGRGADPGIRNNDGETPLQVAERARRFDVAAVLRGSGGGSPAGNSGVRGGEGSTRAGGGGDRALFEAVKSGDIWAVRQLLTEDPTLLNRKDATFGATPLHWAALKGHAEIVRFLLSQGADTTALNKDGETPLQVARRAGRSKVVQILR